MYPIANIWHMPVNTEFRFNWKDSIILDKIEKIVTYPSKFSWELFTTKFYLAKVRTWKYTRLIEYNRELIK